MVSETIVSELIEIRTLDGANIYLLEPALKLQFRARSLPTQTKLRRRHGAGLVLP